MGKLDLILQMIKTGVSASKIIAKYGKKAYDVAKKQSKSIKNWHKDLTKGEKRFLHYGVPSPMLTVPTVAATGHLEKQENIRRKRERAESRKKQRGMSSGGSINSRAIAKKYFKGGLV